MEKLVTVIMGQDCERFIGMALESVKDSDAIVYCDGGSVKVRELQKKIIEEYDGILIQNNYDKEDKEMNGKQRNFYLDFVKKNFPDYWCLVIDADEVVGDLSKIKDFIQTANKGLYPVHMRHFIGNLGQEDATTDQHWAINRLFKVSKAGEYPLVEHPVLSGISVGMYQGTTIWHLGYISGIFDVKNKYDNHSAKSTMHTPEFLKDWYFKHLFGNYPVKKIKLIEIPGIILKGFGIIPDEIYYNTHCALEVRHYLMMRQWLDRFKPKSIVELGCGMGIYGYVAKQFGVDYFGVEKSEWAVEHAYSEMMQGDITERLKLPDTYDLVLVLDVLEHIDEDKLEDTLKIIIKYGKEFLFSIPYLTDPNLYLDPTHKIFKDKQWWLDKLGKYFKIEEVPDSWMFNGQLLIGVKND